jgi:flagellar basal body-associated protein FliL
MDKSITKIIIIVLIVYIGLLAGGACLLMQGGAMMMNSREKSKQIEQYKGNGDINENNNGRLLH